MLCDSGKVLRRPVEIARVSSHPDSVTSPSQNRRKTTSGLLRERHPEQFEVSPNVRREALRHVDQTFPVILRIDLLTDVPALDQSGHHTRYRGPFQGSLRDEAAERTGGRIPKIANSDLIHHSELVQRGRTAVLVDDLIE